MRNSTVLGLLLCIACGDTADSDPDTGPDSDVPSDTGEPSTVPAPSPKGVQIGSEGIILEGCTLDERGPDDALTGMSFTPAEADAALLGSFSGDLTDADRVYDMAFTVEGVRYYQVQGTDCPTPLAIELIGDLTVTDGLDSDHVGWILVDPEMNGEAVLYSEEADGPLLNDVDTEGFQRAGVVLAATVDSDGWTGALGFEGCNGDDCTVTPLGTFTSGG